MWHFVPLHHTTDIWDTTTPTRPVSASSYLITCHWKRVPFGSYYLFRHSSCMLYFKPTENFLVSKAHAPFNQMGVFNQNQMKFSLCNNSPLGPLGDLLDIFGRPTVYWRYIVIEILQWACRCGCPCLPTWPGRAWKDCVGVWVRAHWSHQHDDRKSFWGHRSRRHRHQCQQARSKSYSNREIFDRVIYSYMV